MMAFADYDAYIDALNLNIAADFQMSGNSGAAGRLANLSLRFVPAPSTPTTSTTLDKSDARATNGSVSNAGSGRLSLLGGRINSRSISGVALIVVDMLNISGGLDATSTAVQTTNLPTAALTRYTTGEGVQAAIVVHASVGTTVVTATCEYTNAQGTPSRVTPAFTVGGGLGLNVLGNLYRLPLQAGDTGIQSVESVTLASTTGAAGDFGIVLFKPLAMMFANDIEGANLIDCVSTGRMVGQLNEVLDDACLSCFAVAPAVQATSGAIFLGEA
jgi:hypothetical protein